MLIKMSSGLLESPFFGDRQIHSEMIAGRHTPYYYGETIAPFSTKLQICPIHGEWTSELRDNVTRWLNNGKFNEFYSTDNIDKRYFLTYEGSPTLNVTGNNEGYIEIDFRNVDCYVRSPAFIEVFDLSTNADRVNVVLSNLGSAAIQPIVHIQKIGAGNVAIKNLSNGGQITGLTGLSHNEQVTIDPHYRTINTSVTNALRYDNFSKTYLTLPYGNNHLEVTGACKLKFTYRYLYSSV
ncbi:phage distal tail protein [Cohnella herbarum]|uniref:Phage tail-like C-terminal domain-containing protein n=1 Tax=Cohnella herbarum TaxID=2728023 RepID=A0A7Z2VJ35_9BACL|nr:hypothetical protein HH215_12930 [Cohnella herbarum]